MARSYWLVKSEPDVYAYAQLVKDGKTVWDGVRNFMARNNLRAMKEGDLVFFYHSNVGKEIVGVARVVREAYRSESQGGRLVGGRYRARFCARQSRDPRHHQKGPEARGATAHQPFSTLGGSRFGGAFRSHPRARRDEKAMNQGSCGIGGRLPVC